MNRPSWDAYFFQIAAVVSERATCPRASIGAVLAKNHHVIGTGYNGVAEGAPHCPTTPEHMALVHCEDAVHAEYNALANALVPAFGATLYVVGARSICPDCADRLQENGVTDIRHRHGKPSLDALAREIDVWAAETFTQATPTSYAEHIRREARELAEKPTSGEELADLFHLVARHAGLIGVDLAAEVARKFAINQRRTWGQPEAGTGVVEHIRDEKAHAHAQ